MKAAPSTLPRRAGIAIAAIGLTALAGYGIGRTSRETLSAPALESQAVKTTDPGLSEITGKETQAPSKEERAKQVARIKAQVLELGGTRPVMYDLETDREIAALLAQLSNEELGDFFREATASSRNYGDRLRIIEAWAVRDGPAAIEGASLRVDEWALAVEAYQAWGAKDPDAALRWLREGELSDYAKEHRVLLRKNFLYQLMRTEPEKALTEVPHLDKDEKKDILRFAAASAVQEHDEAKLAQLAEFAAGADEEARDAIEMGQANSLGLMDYTKGFEYIDGLDTTAAKKADLEMSVLEAVPEEKLRESMDTWMARHPDGQDIPERMWEMLGQKLILHREGMRAWLEDLQPGPTRDAFYQESVRHFVSAGERDKALGYIGMIEDPGQRGTALRTMRRMWTESNAGEAKAWIESLPESDRAMLDK
ncbi:hypothetical protein [Luteolibacter luteus]|uniref:Uncharacterized protein n=1 Tax=Luteolibacter luteus TaxID=2728835 RepID=A0A858RDQ7_9BACT|nr:hypothetical protein [Luteolibacter luteus]QJE94313.1 hypothetical protein HHL09_00435 [Luteolibacter luteus]